MHCTDIKRETLYIKNTESGKKTKSSINKSVENKQMKHITKWTEEHPDYMNDENLQQEYRYYQKTSSVDDCRDKILKRVCDNVYLNDK